MNILIWMDALQCILNPISENEDLLQHKVVKFFWFLILFARVDWSQIEPTN